MHKKRHRLSKILFSLTFVLLLSVALWLYRPFSIKQETTSPSELISHQIASIQELATSQYHYTNMGSFEDFSTLGKVKLPLTTKKFIVSYNGLITASIDVNKINTKIDDNQIQVTLPKAHILSHQIDEKSLTVFDESSSILNRLSIEDVYQFTDQQKEKIEQEAVDKGLLEDATAKARDIIKEVLASQKELEYYTIVFN